MRIKIGQRVKDTAGNVGTVESGCTVAGYDFVLFDAETYIRSVPLTELSPA